MSLQPLSKSLSAAEAAEQILKRREARKSFRAFVGYTFPKYRENWHHKRITKVLQGVIDGTEKRVIIEMPPRHGKSEHVSRRLPPAFFGAHPDAKVIQASYSASLASKENRQVQRIMLQPEFRALFPNVQIPSKDSSAGDRRYVRNNQQFEILGTGGQYISAGVGGPITGEGMTLGIVDDPIKNAEEADSETYRDNIWDWWLSTFLTRDEGDAAIVVCATRWHEDDLIGRILAQAKETGEKWTVIKLEALREDMEDKEDPREEGEALWPGKFSKAWMERRRKQLGDRWWNAMYQQQPSATEGNIFKRELWERFDLDMPPKYICKIQSEDTAHDTKSTNDFSVIETWGIWKGGADLLDVWRERVAFPDLKEQTKALAIRDAPSWLLIERKGSGISLIQELQRDTRLPIWGEDPEKPGVVPDKDKVARAQAAVGYVASKKIRIPKQAPWLADFLSEHANFPNGKNDDQVDTTTQFINWYRTFWVQPAQRILGAKGKIRGA